MENNNGNHMHKAVIVFEAVREEQLVECMTLTVMIHNNYQQFYVEFIQ